MTDINQELFARPEIARHNDLMAKDQRKIIDFQRKQLERAEINTKLNIEGYLKSKFFSNIQSNVGFCMNYCSMDKTQKFDSPLRRRTAFRSEIDGDCVDRCVFKRFESFTLLVDVNYY